MQPIEIEEVRKQVASLYWYHTIDLGNGIITPGNFDHRPFLKYYGIPQDLAGKAVLDIGASNGFFSFEFERRGARVTATDLPEWSDHDFGPNFQNAWSPEEGRRQMREPFALAKRVLGSQVERREINIYDLSPKTIGVYDIVFCGDVLCHLTDPIKALWRIKSVTKELAIIATPTWQKKSKEPIALYAGNQRGDSWWQPNRQCLEAFVQSAGFREWKWMADFRTYYPNGKRGPFHGVVHAYV